jgi:hypothetical protein
LLIILLTLVAGAAAETRLGKPLTLDKPIPIDKLVSDADRYAGKTVQVKGTVRDVCKMMGCWMEIADESGKAIRIKVEDGVIVFPKTAVGKTAIAEGTFSKLDAGEKGRKGGSVVYQIQGAGAVILD